jgi:hypothetical protein
MVALSAVCLIAALAAPTAGAAGSKSSKAATAAKKSAAKKSASQRITTAQSKRRLARSIRTINRRSLSNRRNITRLRRTLTTGVAELRGLISTGDTNIDNKINGIVGVVTPILTQLGDGVIQLRDGLLALRAGVETLAAQTIAGFDTVEETFLQVEQAITDVATRTEYGVTAIYTFAPGDDPNADAPNGRTIAAPSADIPDSGTPATASGDLPIAVVPSGATPPNSVSPGTKIALGSSIKSNEDDGGETGDPAGQVGALLTVICVGGGGAGGCGDEGTAAGQPEFDEGQLMCAVGPTEENTFETPLGDIQQSLVNIQEKVSWTDPSQPAFAAFDGDSLVNPLVDAQNESGTGETDDGSCTLPSFGAYMVKIQSQFVDIPTSADPGIAD